jgi:hypothetical protein
MSDRFFVDTNILMYAHDKAAGAKHERAKALVEELWRNRTGVVSTQVEKLTADDRFDDLSAMDLDGRRERTQFKHTENADRPLGLTTFTPPVGLQPGAA